MNCGCGSLSQKPKATGGSSTITINNTLFVGKGGNNSTAIVNRLDKQYLTIAAAIAAASSGTMVEVYAGTYVENITLKDGVYLYLNPGVIIQGKITINAAGDYYIDGFGQVENGSAECIFCDTTAGTATIMLNSANCLDANDRCVHVKGGEIEINIGLITGYVHHEAGTCAIYGRDGFGTITSAPASASEYPVLVDDDGLTLGNLNIVVSTVDGTEAVHTSVAGKKVSLWGLVSANRVQDADIILTGEGNYIFADDSDFALKIQRMNRKTVTVNYTVLDTDQVLLVDSSSAAFTITMGMGSGTDHFHRKIYLVDVGDCGAKPVTFQITGAKINGQSTIALSKLGAIAIIETVDFDKAVATGDYQGIYANGNSGASKTINLNNGPVQSITMTANCTFTLSNAQAGKNYIILAYQDATGSRSITWPATVKFSGGVDPGTSGANMQDMYSLIFDGTNYYATYSTDYPTS